MKTQEITTTSYIARVNGFPRLYINDELQSGLAYITYLTDKNRYGDFAAAGYRLFSVPVFFGFNHLNEMSGLDVFSKGIFDSAEPDFSVFDADIKRILDARPDAYIIPRVNISLSRNWEIHHSDELCEPYEDGTLGRASFASDVWAEEVKRELAVFLEHIRNSTYVSHIAGYQVAGGNTEEWLPLDKKGISGSRAQEKYQDYLKKHQMADCDESFYRFYSELVVQRICEFSAVIKEITKRSVVVGTFYGYTLEVLERTSGHHSLHTLLKCDDVDFICSPVSYSHLRESGRDHPYMLPLASVQLHGKLYFSENDTRTHLSRPLNDMPWYNSPVWFCDDSEKAYNVIKMHAARALIKGHAAWWFDMWGGWFSAQKYMALLQNVREIFENSYMYSMNSVTEVAVFVDEEAYARLNDTSVSSAVCFEIRETLGKMGTPYDLYLASDAEAVINKYKAVILLMPISSFYSDKIISLAETEKKAILKITKENANISTDELRSFLCRTNVHLWCEKDAVIYANDSFVFLHTVEDAPYSLNVPRKCILTDVFTGEIFSFETELKKGSSYLLRYED